MSHSEKLLKAAHAGLHQYGNKSDWKGALHELAQSKARKGETVEAAVSRLLADRDTDMMALIRAERAAEPAAPVAKVAANPPPSALDNLAKARAAETGEDFFTAFSKVADTPEGRRLWAESRRA
ncbi:hypothetical protein SAMN05421742_10951 [Roseospirillum parvum]|uniref:Uncharacterized protein n=2 Tax=Roseospirillum parvum TaxID=83401 RepID=A0A1G8E6K4_9PROT|nr:hypothetical protein SAMN05421742_10951 [Roseospirillum parvum]